MEKNKVSIGILLIGIALVLILGKLGVFHFLGSFLWPLFVLIPGLLLHFFYFNRTLPAGVLIPGGILVTYSLMFFYCNLFGWDEMSYLWPGFMFGAAVGLYEFYLFDRHKERGVLYASMIVGGAAVAFFVLTLLFKLGIFVIAFLLVLAGVLLILRRSKVY